MTKRPKWTSREIKRLRELWPRGQLAHIVGQLPRHSAAAIRQKAFQLGLGRYRDWSAIAAQHRPTFTLR